MGISNVVAQPAAADPLRMGGSLLPAPAAVPKNNGKRRAAAKLTAADVERRAKLHGRLMAWLNIERDRQATNRVEMAIDEDFYDGLQWSDEDAAALLDRGQAPLVFNQIKPTINWLIGSERRTRIEGKVLPRSEDDEGLAEVKTKLIKYLSDVNKTPWKRSECFKSQVVAGVGWMEDCISTDPSEELLQTRFVDWKQVYHDADYKEVDGSDMRYLFRWSFLDLDQAIALCPDFEQLLRGAAVESHQLQVDDDNVWYMGARVGAESTGDYAAVSRRGMSGTGIVTGRDKVKLYECWYRQPKNIKACRACDESALHLHGEEFEADDPEMAQALADGLISVASHVRQQVRVVVMTDSQILYEADSPYKHNRFPFTPAWAYRRQRDGLPYGVIRDIRDAQIDYNKRASKALYILSTMRVVMDKDAVDDVHELRAEIARPDAIVQIRKGAEFRLEQDKQLAEEHIKLMQFDGQMIRDVGGVTDQNLGNSEGGMSGKAIGKLQDQGTIVTAALFDNLRLAIQLQSEIQLSLLEQYYSAAKVVRIVGQNKPIEWLRVNQYDEGAAQWINDITKSAADFIVDEQDFKASTRQAMFESMMDLVGKLEPQVGLALLDMVIDFADVPNKDEIVARIRKLNGQGDPSRKPTPEEEQAAQVRQQKQDQIDQLNLAKLQAEVDGAQATAKATLAKVDQMQADIQKTVAGAVQAGVTAAYEALQAAQIVATVPNVTPVADAILAGAGYKDQGGEDPNLPPPSGALPQMTPQPAGGSYIGAPAGGAGPVGPGAGAVPPPAAPQLQQADGVGHGIETPANDGVTA
jgi:hypothetical protein